MKRILITGADSYIGTSVEKWMNQPKYIGMYQLDTVDMRGNEWEVKDFSVYDTVFHVAGIVHQKETKENEHLYYKVNRDLPIAVAIKARTSGVKQFVILSSMSVYGMSSGTITSRTKPMPNTHYGKSKLQADETIFALESEQFRVAIVRPPMVYGKGCKGNYQLLSKFVKKSPVFPEVKNQRSMIYIENLAEFIRIVIENEKSGVFFPQNQEYVCTTDMVKLIAKYSGKKVYCIRNLDWLIKIININIVKKVFGNLKYEKVDLCNYINFEESIYKSEQDEL